MEVIELKEPLGDFTQPDKEEEVQVFVKKSEKQKSAESLGKIVWRGANAMMTLFFVMASGVQFNDPDPFLWVPLYGIAAILTISVTIRPNVTASRIWRYPYWIHAAFCIGMLIYVLVALVLAATNPKSDGSLNPLTYEEGREMAGIMITSIWLFTCKQSPTIRCIFPRWCQCKKTEASCTAQLRGGCYRGSCIFVVLCVTNIALIHHIN